MQISNIIVPESSEKNAEREIGLSREMHLIFRSKTFYWQKNVNIANLKHLDLGNR